MADKCRHYTFAFRAGMWECMNEQCRLRLFTEDLMRYPDSQVFDHRLCITCQRPKYQCNCRVYPPGQ